MAPGAVARFTLSHHVRNICRREDRIRRSAFDISTLVLSHPEQRFIGENYPKLIVDNDHSLVELFKDALHLAKPLRSLGVGVRHGLSPSRRSLILQEFVRGPSHPSE